MKKIILKFDKDAYHNALGAHKAKNEIIAKIQETAKNELDLTIEVTDSDSLKANIFKAIEKKYKAQNTLNLTGEKLADLMQIDLSAVLQLQNQLKNYDSIDKNRPPSEDEYTITVDNDKELERYNHAIKVIDLINETLRLTENNKFDIRLYGRAFLNVIKQNSKMDGFEPLPNFVKDK